MKYTSLTLSVLAAALGPAAIADVTIVGQTTSYATIQAAVDAAVSGDTLIVGNGTYQGGFSIDGKALAVVGQNGIAPKVLSPCVVKNLPAGTVALISGLNIEAAITNANGFAGLTVSDCVGSVRVHDCTLRGLKFVDFSGSSLKAAQGLAIQSSMGVVVSKSSIKGRDFGFVSGESAAQGGDALYASNSSFGLYDCTLKGGTGSEETYPSGGMGGSACVVEGLTGVSVFASGTSFVGGNGGGGDYIGCTTSGNGGHGLVLTNAAFTSLGGSVAAGPAGNFGPCGLGAPGQVIVTNNSTWTQLPGADRKLSGPSGVTDNYTIPLTVQGQPGDKVWIVAARKTNFRFVSALSGLALVPLPLHLTFAQQGTIGANGVLELSKPLDDLMFSTPAQVWHFQALCIDSLGKGYFSSPLPMVVIDT